MNTRVLRALGSLAIAGLLAACGHSSSIVPLGDRAASAAANGRHVRDVVLPQIGQVTSRNSYNGIYLPFLNAAYGGGESSPVDWGSQVGGKVPPPPTECTDETDQCPVADCDPSDPDCVVQVATLGGAAKAGDVCSPGSKPIGSPLKSTAPNGTTERVADVKLIAADYHNFEIPVGYVYVSDQTGKNYFQPNATFSVGGGAMITASAGLIEAPWVPMGNLTASQLSAGLKVALDAAKAAGLIVNPAAYNIIKGGTVGKADCFSSPHSSTWT